MKLLSVKLKVSYERPEELQHILERLRPDVKSWRKSGNREGQYMKAYIFLNEQRGNHEKEGEQ